MKESTILHEMLEQVMVITLNRPEAENKLNIPMMQELVQLLGRAAENPKCRVIVLTGQGDYFCNGGDLGDFRVKSPLEIREFGNNFIELHRTIISLARPVIAAVQGHALGGGLSLVEACDLAVASREAMFGVPEVKTGIAPMMALTGVARIISRKGAMELALLGECIQAERAKEIGLVNIVCSKKQVMLEALRLAADLVMYNPTALAFCKKLHQNLDGLSYECQLEAGLEMLVSLLKSEDAAEALTAKEENRAPVWKFN